MITNIYGEYKEFEIESLSCETDLGEITILANHHPIITVVKKGKIKIRMNETIKEIELPFDSILEFSENKAKILTLFEI